MSDKLDMHGHNFFAGARLLAEEHASSFAALFNTGSPGVASAEVIGRAALDMQLLAERVARLYANGRHQVTDDPSSSAGAAEGQTETPCAVAVGAPGGGVEGLRGRLEEANVVDRRASYETPGAMNLAIALYKSVAVDAIKAAEQQEARAEQYGKDARRLQWLLENDYVDEAIFNGTTHE